MKPLRLLAAALAAFACTAGAQTLKPGLWEVSTQVGGASAGQMDPNMAQMQQQMASMPPAQRKAMEEMMAKQGVRMGAGGNPGAFGVKVCFTKEMVEKNEMPAQQGNCTTTYQSRSGGTMKFGFACTSPASTGEGEMTIVSPEAYTTKVAVTSDARGKPERTNMTGSGKWLSADCGTVKPITPPVAARTVPPAKTVLPAAK